MMRRAPSVTDMEMEKEQLKEMSSKMEDFDRNEKAEKMRNSAAKVKPEPWKTGEASEAERRNKDGKSSEQSSSRLASPPGDAIGLDGDSNRNRNRASDDGPGQDPDQSSSEIGRQQTFSASQAVSNASQRDTADESNKDDDHRRSKGKRSSGTEL